jgi:hypothetical protein
MTMPHRDHAPADRDEIDDIDLRESTGRDGRPSDAIEEPDRAPDLDERDLDNPFSTGTAASRYSAPPPRSDGGATMAASAAPTVAPVADAPRAGRPLGPNPMPGPVTGQQGSLDLADVGPRAEDEGPGFLPSRPRRLRIESVLVRLVATCGVVAIGTAVGAILVGEDVAGWITGLVVSLVSVALAALLWRSRRL